MPVNQDGITIGTISGGIVNFGGAFCISPISITNTSSGSGGGGSSGTSITSTLDSLSEILDTFSPNGSSSAGSTD